jgi:hypothetical protein
MFDVKPVELSGIKREYLKEKIYDIETTLRTKISEIYIETKRNLRKVTNLEVIH